MDEESAAIAVLVTTSTAEEAEKIGRMLVERRLAACANIVSGMRSIFRWDNKISVESECLMIIKTTKQQCDSSIITRCRRLSPSRLSPDQSPI